MSAITQAQQDCLERAYEILGEHFDGALIAVVSTTENNDSREFSKVYWKGGRMQALGLAHETIRQIQSVPEHRDEV